MIIKLNHEHYLNFPTPQINVRALFSPNGYMRFPDDASFTVTVNESDGVKCTDAPRAREFVSPLGGYVIFVLESQLNREKIDQKKISFESYGLEDYLKEEKNCDPTHPAVIGTREEIISGLSKYLQEQPYALVECIVSWMYDNIKGVSMSSEILDQAEEIMQRNKWDVADLLGLIVVSEYAQKISSLIKVGADATSPRKIANDIFNQAIKINGTFNVGWMGRGAESASTTLARKEGRCQGISNAYLALARSLGIPSKMVGGYIRTEKGEGYHQWVASYLKPYGWVEVDPTLGKVKDFSFKNYFYALSSEIINNIDDSPFPTLVLEG